MTDRQLINAIGKLEKLTTQAVRLTDEIIKLEKQGRSTKTTVNRLLSVNKKIEALSF